MFKYKDFKRIVNNSNIFFSKKVEYKGYTIESFNYRLAGFSDFDNQIKKEMRGIAFIYGKEIKEPQLFTIGLHKFFNYGEGDTLDILKKKEIISINDKLDGSLIMFGKLPNGEIIAKTKKVIESEIIESVKKLLLKNKNIEKFISKILDKGYFPIFEYIGPDNQIVIPYKKSDLILLAIRDSNGKYLNLEDFDLSNINYAKKFNITFEEVLKKQENDKGYEGFVISFSDGDKLKVKLKDYVLKHRSKDDLGNIKNLIKICLEDKTDDLRLLFLEDKDSLDKIDRVESKVFHYYDKIVKDLTKIIEKDGKLERKDFAIKYKDANFFGLLMSMYSKGELKKEDIKSYILNDKEFIKTL